ncbi:MAG: SGNH/GDSL hydrolase family protein [Gammaproteobacteria bacterium]|nr:SGNH/GDSL hydrolase family protein [Pseudomonadales bacterium]MCP5329325.1 SGNH/GDSL hydrolase family protein [Pseudomonadales bacterium]
MSVINKKKNTRASGPHLLLRILGIVLLSLSLLPAVQAQSPDGLRWVTTWTASPSTLPPGMLPEEARGDAYQDQTLRMIAHTSIGGDMVRVRIANTHGNKPLLIGSASIALQTQGSAVDERSLTRLSFAGERSITIPRGGFVISDPVAFSVPQMGNLSVSLYLPQASGTPTSHSTAFQQNFVSAAGDYSMSGNFEATETPAMWQYLSAIDVGRQDDITAIVTLGDSITDGWGSTESANHRWPNFFARRLLDDPDVRDFAVVNAGLSGNRVLHENSPRFGENLLARFERDVLALSGVSHIVLLEGINDIGMGRAGTAEEVSADEVIAGYRQIILRAHDRGLKIIGATLTPFEGAAYYTEAGELKRQAINAWIRGSSEFDGIIDFETPVRDPAQHTRLLPSFTTDNLHPNDEGYEAMAEVVDLELFAPDN